MAHWLIYRSVDRLHLTGLFFVAVVALLTLANPSEARVAQAQVPAGENDVLQPGAHWVGWLGEEQSVESLFNTVPRLQAIWVWKALQQDWIMAQRGSIPGEQLTTVHPGMALYVLIDGSLPVLWPYGGQSPATGLVELYQGENYVAWGGPSSETAQAVYDGVGTSLEDVMVWRSEGARWQKLNSWGRVARGDVLWVDVDRDIDWLQPTGRWPHVEFAGEVASHVRDLVYRDLHDAMTFFAKEWGVQADHSRTMIYVANDGELLIELIAQTEYGCRRSVRDSVEDSVRDRWKDKTVAAWHCGMNDGVSFLVLRESRWHQVSRNRGNALVEARYDLVHEYTHAVQHQLDGGLRGHPLWLEEGMAFWVEGLLYVDDQELDRDWLRRDNEVRLQGCNYNRRAPALYLLEDSESAAQYGRGDYLPWGYELGSIAIERLVGEVVGGRHERQASILEYWRQALHPRIPITVVPGLGDEPDGGEVEIEVGGDEPDGGEVEIEVGGDEPDGGEVVIGWGDENNECTVEIEEEDEPSWGMPFEQAFGKWRKGFGEGACEPPDDTEMAAEDAPQGGPFSGRSQYPH